MRAMRWSERCDRRCDAENTETNTDSTDSTNSTDSTDSTDRSDRMYAVGKITKQGDRRDLRFA